MGTIPRWHLTPTERLEVIEREGRQSAERAETARAKLIFGLSIGLLAIVVFPGVIRVIIACATRVFSAIP